MAYRKNYNKYKRWEDYCIKHKFLIETLNLSKWIFEKEDNFRDFATFGRIDKNGIVILNFESLSKKQFRQLFDFTNNYFEMDMILFDKFEAIRTNQFHSSTKKL